MNYNPTKQKLQSKDIYSILLFALFNLTKNKDYAILSQMACIIDRDSLVRLCAQFGGVEIRIPTLNELRTLVNALGIYYSVDIKGDKLPNNVPQKTLDIYMQLKEMLNGYIIEGVD